jgi:HK97 family phage prohead protease
MTPDQRRDAASARAAAVPSRAARPSQRRSDVHAGSRAYAPGPLHRIEVRGLDALDSPLVFDGYASVTGRPYEMWDAYGPYLEQVHVGAFAETLAADGLDVPLVIDHTSSRRIARTGNATSPLMLSEVSTGEVTGLHVLAPTLDRTDPDVAYIAPKLRSGLIDEMSFRFMITSGRWNDDWDEYHIHAVDIHRGDVAIVGYGANPHTAGAGLRSLDRYSIDDLRAELDRRSPAVSASVAGRDRARALLASAGL